MTDQELAFRDAIRLGFYDGDFVHAYETRDLETALSSLSDEFSPEFRSAFILGFFASYALHEIPASDREAFDEAYWSDAGKAVIAAGYCDSRQEEYRQEHE